MKKTIKLLPVIAVMALLVCTSTSAQELLTNPGFEDWTGGIPDDWTVETDVTILEETTTVYEGGSSVSLESTSTANRGLFQLAPVTPGTDYEFSAYIYGANGASDLGLYVNWLDSGGGTISGEGTYYNTGSGSWELVTSGTITAPAGAVNARCRIRCYVNTMFGGYVDAASFVVAGGGPTATPGPPTFTPTVTPTGPTPTPPPVPTVSIYDIQYTTDPSGDSPYVDQNITTVGVVTAYETGNYYVWIQDGTGPWSGLLIYNPPGSIIPGDRVQVSGTIKEYYGMTEISPVSAITVIGSDPIPAPQVLTTLAVNAEQWESVFVRVENVTVTNEDMGFGEWEVDDSSGPCVVNDLFTYSYSPALSDMLAYVQGPLDYSFDAFKIEPRNDGDILPGGGDTPTPTNTPTPPGPTPTPPPVYNFKINEVHVNPDGVDAGSFVEIYNADNASHSLDGYQLVGVNGFDGAFYNTIMLTGTIEANGFFVVAQDGTVPNSDMVNAMADYQNGPDNILLRAGAVTVVDAIGYGDFGGGETFAGEGSPVAYPNPTNNKSLCRIPDGTDTDNNATDFVWGELSPGEANIPAGSDTPTPSPYTPTPPPTATTGPGTPTHTPEPTPTTGPGTPTSTPTPSDCTVLGVTIEMPSSDFGPGDECYLMVEICNPSHDTFTDRPLFVILDVFGQYFFAPAFNDFDHYTIDVTPGLQTQVVLSSFSWPTGAGAADGIYFHSAMTDAAVTGLFGDFDSFMFGWHE